MRVSPLARKPPKEKAYKYANKQHHWVLQRLCLSPSWIKPGLNPHLGGSQTAYQCS